MPDVDLNALMRSLYARRHEAVLIPFEERQISSGPPLEHQCYLNNDRWCRENPGHKSICGWLVFDFNRDSEGLWPVCRLTAHSVIEDPAGNLFDLTPITVPRAASRTCRLKQSISHRRSAVSLVFFSSHATFFDQLARADFTSRRRAL